MASRWLSLGRNQAAPVATSPSHSAFAEGCSRDQMLREVFEAFDDDGNGFLSFEEFETLHGSDAKQLFEAMDKAKSGFFTFSVGGKPKDHKMTFGEYRQSTIAAHKDLSYEAFAEMASRWLSRGRNKAAPVRPSASHGAFQEFGGTRDQMLREVFVAFDDDGNGFLSFEEFETLHGSDAKQLFEAMEKAKSGFFAYSVGGKPKDHK